MLCGASAVPAAPAGIVAPQQEQQQAAQQQQDTNSGSAPFRAMQNYQLATVVSGPTPLDHTRGDKPLLLAALRDGKVPTDVVKRIVAAYDSGKLASDVALTSASFQGDMECRKDEGTVKRKRDNNDHGTSESK